MPHHLRNAGRSRQTGLNDALAWALVVFVALVPIPFGSTRPFFWGVNAGLVGLLGIIYATSLSYLREPFHYGLGRLPVSLALYLLLAAYLVVQALPLGDFASLASLLPPVDLPAGGGGKITSESISLAPGNTWLMLLRWGTFGVFLFLVLQIGGSLQRRSFLLHAALAIIAAYAILGLASLLQFGDTILGLPKWAYQGSATATFVNRNSFATFLAFGTVLSTSLFAGALLQRLPAPGEEPTRARLDPMLFIYVVALAVIVPALLATQSRMGTFSAAAGCLVVLIAALIRMPGLWLRVLVTLPLAVAAIAAAVFGFGQNLLERLGSTESSADVRLDLYRQVVEMISARPWPGFGGGSFEVAFPLFHKPPVSPDLVWDKAHNSYLALWAELGLVAGSIPILLFVLALARIVWGMGGARQAWAARAAGMGALTVAALHSLVDFSLEIQANTLMLLFIVGAATAGAASSARHR